jgi:hypothetical protein
MSYERPEESSQPPVSKSPPSSGDKPDSASAGNRIAPDDVARLQSTAMRADTSVDQPTNGDQPEKPGLKDAPAKDVTVLVRGETLSDQGSKSAPPDAQPKDKVKVAPKPVSEAKMKKHSHLPALDDDADVGVQKEHVVTRDGKPDLAFTGTLLASAAPPPAPKGKWQEYRVYETSAGKHVFSKVARSVFADEPDSHQAEVFDPSPSSMPSQLLRTARDLTRSHPLTWTDATAAFFGYDPLAKALYRKLSGKFEEHIG